MNEQKTANFTPYEGDEPYIFVSYSHEDSFRVIPLLNALNKAGYRIWYDGGIHAGYNWRESVGTHIMDCSVCMPLLSTESLQSPICMDEIDYAQAESKTRRIFPIRLEQITLPPQLFQLHGLHYLRLYDYPNADAFVDSLSQEPVLQSCRKTAVDMIPAPIKTIKWSITGEIKWRLENNEELIISAASTRGRMQNFSFDVALPFSNTPWQDKRGNIKSVVIEDGITKIGDCAFLGCYNLSSVTLPDSLIYMGHSVFNGCTSLKYISFPGSVASIGEYIFSRCPNLKYIQIAPTSKHYCSENGVLFNHDKTELLRYPSGKEDVEYTIPDTVLRIGTSAFSRCDSLNHVFLPNGILFISKYAFSDCSALNEITIPSSVTGIEKGAFFGCDNMRTATIHANIAVIDDDVFCSCGRLSTVSIPSSITEIGNCSFCGCDSLHSITISRNAQYVEDGPWASFGLQTTIIRQ